jgi:uncharacterized damage-inducible protein DinB
MLAMLRDLVLHKEHANAGLLKATREFEDAELRKLLHHILVANRFWLMLSRGRAFSIETESAIPVSFGVLAAVYRETHLEENEWTARLREGDLEETIETPFLPGHKFSIAQGLMQVCMHSHAHRAQCATRLRMLGGTPPAMDFVTWLKDRAPADWNWIVEPVAKKGV